MDHRAVRARGPRRVTTFLATAAAALAVPLATGQAIAATAGPDRPISVDAHYVKANGAQATAGDAITTCGVNRRQQNEPTAAVDPSDPDIITSGSNDYCTVELAGGTWAGFYRSTDRGDTWTDSLLPGYPTDESTEGLASPLHRRGISNAGDPVQAWDRHGRLFYMGNAFNRVKPQNGSVWVATYDQGAAHYVRTVIVGSGTPAVSGKFNDKTSIEVDRGLDSPHDGNVYVAWSVFQGGGNNEIMFARSTDHGATFSQPMKISVGSKGNQFADIAVTRDGTVYVAWNGFVGSRALGHDAMLFVKSTDGGRTFSRARVAVEFDGFDAADFAGDPEAAEEAHEEAFEHADGPESEAEETSAGNARDCGSGPFACQSGFVFFRHSSQPRITADPADATGTVYMVYDATDPATEEPSDSTYNTAPVAPDGTLMVGQGVVYLTRTTDGGGSWTAPVKLAPTPVGHQLFPDINADAGHLFAVWHDSRADGADYSVQNPPGNATATDAFGFHLASKGLDTYGATSDDGGSSWDIVRLSSESQMPNYEMFGDRGVPFHGDYNYVSSVGDFGYGAWTDTRQVVGGDDPRYDGGEGFDVHQCRTQDADGTWSADTCPNAGGLDQDVFGAAITP
jgi:hypothetical protein